MNDPKISRQVREVICGKPISEIPLIEYPSLRQGLNVSKNSAISAGQVGRIKKIQEILTQMDTIEKSQKQSNFKRRKRSKENSSSSMNKSSKTKIQTQDLDDMIQSLLLGSPYSTIPAEYYSSLLKRIKIITNNLVHSGRWADAQPYEDLRKEVIQYFSSTSISQAKTKRQNSIILLLEDAERALFQAENDFQEQLRIFEARKKRNIAHIQKYNEKEMIKFIHENKEPLPPFSKPLSSQLLEMRQKEKVFLTLRLFKDAANLRDYADEIEDFELENAEQRRLKSLNHLQEHLEETHQQRIKNAQLKWDMQRDELINYHQKNIEQIKNRIGLLERQLEIVNSSKRYSPKSNLNVSQSFNQDSSSLNTNINSNISYHSNALFNSSFLNLTEVPLSSTWEVTSVISSPKRKICQSPRQKKYIEKQIQKQNDFSDLNLTDYKSSFTQTKNLII